jgi:hypothetical protein
MRRLLYSVEPSCAPRAQKAKKDRQELNPKNEVRKLEESYLIQFGYWFDEIGEFLSSVSVQRKDLSESGNSELMLDKFNKVHRYIKPGTKLGNTVSIL